MALPQARCFNMFQAPISPCRASHCYGMGYPSPASAVALLPRRPRPRDGSSRGPPRHSLLFLGQDGMGWMAPNGYWWIKIRVCNASIMLCIYIYIYNLLFLNQVLYGFIMFYQHLSTTVSVIVLGDAPTDWVRPNMFSGSRSTMLRDSILDLYQLKEPPINICRVSLMVVPCCSHLEFTNWAC